MLEALQPTPGPAQPTNSLSANILKLWTTRIDLTNFSGKYTNWAKFRDFFKLLVIDRELITSVQKQHHLKTNLAGIYANAQPALIRDC